MTANDDGNRLGAYLRARRGLVTPEQAGIPAGGTRRVPGLRREELAMLAGISADYYLRLERGRDNHPSPRLRPGRNRLRSLLLDPEEQAFHQDWPAAVSGFVAACETRSAPM